MNDKVFDLDALDASDEGYMTVMANGKPTSWVWTFCGPGHPRAIAQSNRVAREQLSRNRLKEQAQANGRKWKAPEQSPEELLRDNVNFVMERLLNWSDATVGGQPYPFTEENARAILMDPKKGALLQQAIEFIIDDNSFTQRSAKN
jgi:hypothetical protein